MLHLKAHKYFSLVSYTNFKNQTTIYPFIWGRSKDNVIFVGSFLFPKKVCLQFQTSFIAVDNPPSQPNPNNNNNNPAPTHPPPHPQKRKKGQ